MYVLNSECLLCYFSIGHQTITWFCIHRISHVQYVNIKVDIRMSNVQYRNSKTFAVNVLCQVQKYQSKHSLYRNTIHVHCKCSMYNNIERVFGTTLCSLQQMHIASMGDFNTGNIKLQPHGGPFLAYVFLLLYHFQLTITIIVHEPANLAGINSRDLL